MQLQDFSIIFNLVLLGCTYLIIQPLKASIESLRNSVDANNHAVTKLQDLLADERARLARVEESVKIGHRRMDELNDRFNELENRCVNCNRKTAVK